MNSTYQGIARTQSPTNKNYALELPTFGAIVGVSLTEVQWKGLALEEPPSWSWFTSVPGKYAVSKNWKTLLLQDEANFFGEETFTFWGLHLFMVQKVWRSILSVRSYVAYFKTYQCEQSSMRRELISHSQVASDKYIVTHWTPPRHGNL